MNTMQMLGFYPDAIENAAETAEAAMTDAGVCLPDIDYMYDDVRERFENGELNYSDITNSLISEYFEYAKEKIEQEISGIEISYYVNCDDTHFYVNGEEYWKGEDLITDLKERGIDISLIEEATYGNISATRAVLNIKDDDLLYDLINGCEDKDGHNMAELSYGEEIHTAVGDWGILNLDGYEIIEKIDRGERFKEFEVAALLLENGKRVYEISYVDEKDNTQHIMRADRPELLREYVNLGNKLDTAVRSYIESVGELSVDGTPEEKTFLKHLKNREKQKESGKEYDM